MIIPVYMLAFNDDKEMIRAVEIPDEEYKEANGITNQILELVFKYGQNDFQPKQMPSVSVGDVVKFFNQYFMVKEAGYEELSKEEFDNLIPPTTDYGYGFAK